MGSLSAWHWLIVLAIVMLLFGRGRISALLGDIGKGIGGFRREVRDLAGDRVTSRKASPLAKTSRAPVHPAGEVVGGEESVLPDKTLTAPQSSES